MTQQVAFLGLGIMGFPMAGHLAKAGHDVTVFNRTAAKAQAWRAQHAGRIATTPAEAASVADFVFCCVGRDEDVREVTVGAGGAFAAMRSGSVFVDHTTTSALAARDLYRASAEHGIGFLDAPVSGGQSGAQNGALSIMIGGDDDVCSRALPLLAAYARVA